MIKPILKVVPALQSLALAKHNADFALGKKSKKASGFVKLAADNIAGTALIKAEVDLIEGME